MTNFNLLFKKLNIKPINYDIYFQAFTHPSFANENRFANDYQRLEFLGDAILELEVSQYIFDRFHKMDEGKMTLLRSKAVSGVMLARHGRELGLSSFIRFGNNSSVLSQNENILADVFEALVAAIYIDLGPIVLRKFLRKNVLKFIDETSELEHKNPKTVLQEYLQSESRELIKYNTRKVSEGFESVVVHDKKTFAKGKGSTKKDAEVDAAQNALKLLNKGVKGETN